MNILFIHGNYPAQFRSLAEELGKQGLHDIKYLTARKDPEKYPIKGVQVIQYEDVKSHHIEPETESQGIVQEIVKRGEIIQRSLQQLLKEGYNPKLVFFHGGNGLGAFIKNIMPKATMIGYFEWHFSHRCANLILNRNDIAAYNFIQMRNISTENEILQCDACVVPTKWQAMQFPEKLQPYLSTIFDGVDTKFFKPAHNEFFNQTIIIEGENDTITVEPNERLLTYATRGMEPMRGFPDFMKALPALLEMLPNLKVLIGGRDRSAYGPACRTHNGSWKDMILDKIPQLKEHPRIVYTGLLDYNNYRRMLQRTNLHCYFTMPYVTSWSLFEAAACGAPILTNQSDATTGTILIPEENTLATIEEIHQSNGLQLALNMLNIDHPRISFLDDSYTLNRAKSSWEDLINQALSKQSK